MKKNSFEALTLKIVLIAFCLIIFSGCASKSNKSKQLSYKINSSYQKVSRPVTAFSPSGKFLAVAKDKIIKLVVSERVPDATGQEQHPVKKGDESGQLILGRIKK